MRGEARIGGYARTAGGAILFCEIGLGKTDDGGEGGNCGGIFDATDRGDEDDRDTEVAKEVKRLVVAASILSIVLESSSNVDKSNS